MSKKSKLKLTRVQELFNRAIVERDGRCVICGRSSSLQCSHFFTVGAHSGLRFHPDNAHAMCAACHIKHHRADPLMYAEWMQQNHREALIEMRLIKVLPVRYTQGNLAEICELIRERAWDRLKKYLDLLRLGN